MYEQLTHTGLGNDDGGDSLLTRAWNWCKRISKTRLGKIGIGLLARAASSATGGTLGALIATAATINALRNPFNTTNPNKYVISDDYTPVDKNEQNAILFWNENLYIPFLLRIEELITGNNQQKNQALILMGIYETALKEQVIASEKQSFFRNVVDNFSFNGLLHRYVYVLGTHNDIRNMLTVAPSQKTTITTNTYLSEFNTIFINDAFTEMEYMPGQIEVLLLDVNGVTVDLNLNTPTEKNETEDLTTKVTNPVTSDGKNIIETIAEAVNASDTKKIKLQITGTTKNLDGTNTTETITIDDALPILNETSSNNIVPIHSIAPVDNEIPSYNETSSNNVIPISNIAPVDNEIPSYNETSSNNVIPISNIVPVDNQIPSYNETPSKTESSLANTFKQAVIFAAVAVVINKIVKSK